MTVLAINRRTFVGSSALALTMPGCATTRVAATGPARCLAPVKVSPERVIRTVAGLRPYRRSGFVVRAEPLGSKRLVHNYGHGGSGFTLSWGTGRLARDLGLPGHSGPVAVIGSGVVGLAQARLIQEAGYPVTLYTSALPPETTSNIAGGQWHIAGLFDDDFATPAFRAQLAAAQNYSWRRAQLMTGDDYGIHWTPTYMERRSPPTESDPYEPGGEWLPKGSHPFPTGGLYRFDTMYAETGRMLRQLMRDVQLAGGRFVIRSFSTPADIAALPETLVFNCTGLGSAALFGDTELIPVRGQLAILIPQPEVDYAFAGNAGYMFPRADGIVLGGTFERGVGVAEPQPADIAEIVDSHRRLYAGFRCG